VVVLDESGETAKVFQRYLDGYVTLQAATVEEAARIVDERPVQAIVLGSSDVSLVWENRQPADERIQRLPTIICPLQTNRVTARNLGVAAYLTKPVTRERLASALLALGGDTPFGAGAARSPNTTVQAPSGGDGPTARSSRTTTNKRPRSVVIADDDPEMARLLTMMMKSSLGRCQVRSARDGAECLRLLREERPDALFLDLLMPGLDGYGVLENLKGDALLRDLPVVVITAKSNEEEVVVARTLTIARPGGLSVGETVRCLKRSLDALAVSH
jgi:CheY-like chemotaxis protein